jgi:hypothetical protein
VPCFKARLAAASMIVAPPTSRQPTGSPNRIQVGCPDDAKDGLGSRLTRLLVQQLGGTMTRESATPGCRITIMIPSVVADDFQDLFVRRRLCEFLGQAAMKEQSGAHRDMRSPLPD